MKMDISDQPIDDESTASEQDEEEEEEEDSYLKPCDVKAKPEDRNAANQPTGPTEPKARQESVDDDDSSSSSSSSPDCSSSSSSDDEDIPDAPSATKSRPQPLDLTAASSLNHGREESAVNSPQPPPPLKSPNKRVRTESLAVGGDATSTRPAKRLKERGSFNKQYLPLLNQEIQAAAAGSTYPEPPLNQDEMPSIPPSQIGLTVWSTAEKEALFNALSRFGRHNTPAIAARIKTKTQFEVAQYLELLEAASTKLVKSSNAEKDNDLEPILPGDIPAATEISTHCCKALGRAADRLALRQEKHEQEAEKERWGKESWLITKANIAKLEKMQETLRKNLEAQPEAEEMIFDSSEGEEAATTSVTATTLATAKSTTATAKTDPKGDQKLLKSIEMFKVKNWLELSERVFMNSAANNGGEDDDDGTGNWVTIPTTLLEEENAAGTPAIRSTALEDFYSLVVSLTRRIVATIIYVSEARVRAKGELRARAMKNMVWKEDIEAAVASLGLGGMNEWVEFWGEAPRRLGLDVVVGDEIPTKTKNEEVMGYDEVERSLLSCRGELDGLAQLELEEQEDDDESEDQDDDESEDEDGDEVEQEEEDEDEDEEERQVTNEMVEAEEAVRPFVIHPRIKEVMRTRIRAAREQEGYADRLDLVASAEEEKRLWAVLGKSPGNLGEENEDGQKEQTRPPPAIKGSVEELYEDFCHGSAGRPKTSVVDLGMGARWELDWLDEKKKHWGNRDRIRAGTSSAD